MRPGAIYSGIDGSRQYETGEPGAKEVGGKKSSKSAKKYG